MAAASNRANGGDKEETPRILVAEGDECVRAEGPNASFDSSPLIEGRLEEVLRAVQVVHIRKVPREIRRQKSTHRSEGVGREVEEGRGQRRRGVHRRGRAGRRLRSRKRIGRGGTRESW